MDASPGLERIPPTKKNNVDERKVLRTYSRRNMAWISQRNFVVFFCVHDVSGAIALESCAERSHVWIAFRIGPITSLTGKITSDKGLVFSKLWKRACR